MQQLRNLTYLKIMIELGALVAIVIDTTIIFTRPRLCPTNT